MGYTDTTNILYKLLDPADNSDRRYKKPIKVVSVDMHSTVKLNDKFHLNSVQSIRKKIMPWNATDIANCFQLEISCNEAI